MSDEESTSHDLTADLDVLLTRHEDEDIASGMREVNLQGLLDGAVNIVFAWRLAEEDVDGESSTRDREAGRVVEEAGELCGSQRGSQSRRNGATHLLLVHGGRGDDELEIASSSEDCGTLSRDVTMRTQRTHSS